MQLGKTIFINVHASIAIMITTLAHASTSHGFAAFFRETETVFKAARVFFRAETKQNPSITITKSLILFFHKTQKPSNTIGTW